MSGNVELSKELQLKSLPLINALFEEVNPIPIKSALDILGFDFGLPRPPLTCISDNLKNKLELLLKV